MSPLNLMIYGLWRLMINYFIVFSLMDENISISIRIKPSKENAWIQENCAIKRKDNQSKDTYVFDSIFNENHTTLDIYSKDSQKIIENCIKGYHGVIMAYGQTNSGKTYTMLGTERNKGLISYVASDLFRFLFSEKNRDYLIRVSYFEIYNEVINDLIGEGTDLQIIEDTKGFIIIKGIVETDITEPDQMINVLNRGQYNRKISSNNYNEQSSRSHTIFRIIIESQSKDGLSARTSFLHLVDLAGSESVGKNNLEGARAKEGHYINKSLLSLQRVIKALSEKQVFIPYRDSKLTRILKNSLGGNSKVAIICTMSPELKNINESTITLRFATNAKTIVNKIYVNESLKQGQILQHYKDKVKMLTDELEEIKKKHDLDKEEAIKKLDLNISEIKAKYESDKQISVEMEAKYKLEKEAIKAKYELDKQISMETEIKCKEAIKARYELDKKAIKTKYIEEAEESKENIKKQYESLLSLKEKEFKSKNEELKVKYEEQKKKYDEEMTRIKSSENNEEIYLSKLQSYERKITQLTKLILESESKPVEHVEEPVNNSFGLFSSIHKPSIKSKPRENSNSIITILAEKEAYIKKLEARIKELEAKQH